jgi:predicted Zn-dependent protease
LAGACCIFLSGVSTRAALAATIASTLQSELNRNFAALKVKADPPPYFMAYEASEQEEDAAVASLGALLSSNHSHTRGVDTTVRVGSPQFDNYHPFNGSIGQFTSFTPLSIDDAPDQMDRALWLDTDRVYKAASQRLLQLKTDNQLLVNDKDTGADFSSESPQVFSRFPEQYSVDMRGWEQKLRQWSIVFEKFPDILQSAVVLSNRREVKTFVDTEGTSIEQGSNFLRFEVSASSVAPDGMGLFTFQSFEASDPKHLPSENVLQGAVQKVASDMQALLKAPPAEPFVGPAILSGRASAVFFHEIFGHRIEGHRQKDVAEGQTFTKMLNQRVLPEFLSVVFDPTKQSFEGNDLNGYYEFDDEGVKARPVTVVDHGILKTFLLSRSLVKPFDHSNGHGRRQSGYEVVSRQSNLIVESAKQVSDQELRQALLDEILKQGKPYGLYFDQVSSGYTTTRRQGLQAFTVVPLVVYRLYADGRPDELIRGVDIVGTPLASFQKIVATSNHVSVFNGYCGAESGSVPVSAVSPAILVSEIEVQKQRNSQQMPPLLPRPGGAVNR